MKISVYFSVSFFALCVARDFESPSENLVQKKVVVGDEFPTISIGFMNNRTEYKIELDTAGHSCERPYRCEVFVTLTEMFCKRNVSGGIDEDQPYIEIHGMTSERKEVDVKWCREYGINEDFAQDEFVSLRDALLTPRGDWTKANATVLIMASFYAQAPINTAVVPIKDSSVEVLIENDQTEFEFELDPTTACKGGTCSMGAYLEINCLEGSKGSAGIQLDVLTMNNRSVSRVLCPLKCVNPAGGHEKRTTYLLNMKKLKVRPTGSWSSPMMFGRITLSPILSSDVTTCGESYYDCNDGCEVNPAISEELDQDYLIEGNEDLMQMRCVPWAWVCGSHEKYCPKYCTSVRKFCPRPPEIDFVPEEITTRATPNVKLENNINNGTTVVANKWMGEIMSCRMYYLFFFVPLLLILTMFFGTVYLVRRRQMVVELEQQREMNRVKHTFHLFGKIPRNIPYQMVVNETG